MKAIVLAAGRGSRMKKLTDKRPKCLVELDGKPLLQWQLDAFRQAGIDEIAVVTGYKRELLASWGLVEFHNPCWAVTNMVSSLTFAAEWLKFEPCLVSYSDIFYNASAVSALMNCPASLAVTYDPNWRVLWERRFENPLVDAETFRLNQDGTLVEIGNKPNTIEEIEGQYMGLLRITPDGWSELKRIRAEHSDLDCNRMHMTGMLHKIIEAGNIKIQAIPYRGCWGEVDNENDLVVAQNLLNSSC